MTSCECEYLPEKYHFVHYGITEPGSMQEHNPWCPEHGHLHQGPTTSDRMSVEQARRILDRVQEALTSLTSEVRSTSYRPRYDEGMTHAINTIREALGDTDG